MSERISEDMLKRMAEALAQDLTEAKRSRNKHLAEHLEFVGEVRALVEKWVKDNQKADRHYQPYAIDDCIQDLEALLKEE